MTLTLDQISIIAIVILTVISAFGILVYLGGRTDGKKPAKFQELDELDKMIAEVKIYQARRYK